MKAIFKNPYFYCIVGLAALIIYMMYTGNTFIDDKATRDAKKKLADVDKKDIAAAVEAE